MSSLPIDRYQLRLEHYNNRLRIIIANDSEEIVCRKETRNNLLNFLESNEHMLFKGRLQLMNDDTFVSIIVKGELIGRVEKTDFIHLIHSLNK
ncbi:MAG: hypothetical protein EBU66_12200 [Bacteroidetes bacterium]|jgi:hypothetical protein|nr:hypothetical protein [bacterium]NBP65405.1 hypothetical protein [Bacteroidota bacterium]